MRKRIIYEQPLNERIRHFLRLEHLLTGMMYHLKGPSEWDSRATMSRLIEVLEYVGRVDFKKELIKDLEYHSTVLERWQRTPNVDTERLSQLLTNIKRILKQLDNLETSIKTVFNGHHLVNAIRSRNNIVGGDCRCDLAGYYYWLHKSPKQRQTEFNMWLSALEPLREAIELDLYLIRNNAMNSQETATTGFFQSALDAQTMYQLIQVIVPLEQPYYPEISAGKQRVTIKFFEQPHIETTPLPTEQDVNFELCCCLL